MGEGVVDTGLGASEGVLEGSLGGEWEGDERHQSRSWKHWMGQAPLSVGGNLEGGHRTEGAQSERQMDTGWARQTAAGSLEGPVLAGQASLETRARQY